MKASVKIILKKTKLKNDVYPINLRITINRKSKFYKTPYNVSPKYWNNNASEFNSKFPNYLQCNRILDKIKQEASKILDKLIENDHEFSIKSFDFLFRPKEVEKRNFISYFEQKRTQLKESGKISSYSSYYDTITALFKFLPEIDTYDFPKSTTIS